MIAGVTFHENRFCEPVHRRCTGLDATTVSADAVNHDAGGNNFPTYSSIVKHKNSAPA
jgi:hypothetical protein